MTTPSGETGAPSPILYFGSYDGGPGRNAILHEALHAADAAFIEHRVEVWPDTGAKLGATTPIGAVRALIRQGRAWPRLALGLPPVASLVVVGSTAHLDMPLARLVARRLACPLVFDPLVSVAETLRDRGLAGSTGARRWLDTLEGGLFRLADVVLADSAAHAQAWTDELGVPAERFRVVPAGAPAAYRSVDGYAAHDRRMRVAYFGQYIPLHGVPTILHAAAALRDAPIDFVMAGRGQTLRAARDMAHEMNLPNVHFDETWRAPGLLARDVLAPADVCLGAFSSSPKAERVVPFKVYAALAAGRTVLTGDTPAVRELLRPGLELKVVPCDNPAALADALRELAGAPEHRVRLAAAGRRAFDARFSAPVLGPRLIGVFEEAIQARAGRMPATRPVRAQAR